MSTTHLKRYLSALKEGHSIDLNTRKNQHGETIATEWLSFERGLWVVGNIQCHSSSWYGLGTCQCNSYEPTDEDVVSREYALKLLREKALAECKSEEERQVEIAWLNRALESFDTEDRTMTDPAR